MTTTTKRASLQETLDFCNKVREAGGGNPLDALIPAVPVEPSRCLIAKNLNFNCEVNSEFMPGQVDGSGKWMMHLDDEQTRNRIAESLQLETVDFPQRGLGTQKFSIVLPDEIGRVAADFDALSDELAPSYSSDVDDDVPATQVPADLAELFQYIDEASKESYMLAGANVTPDGKIIL